MISGPPASRARSAETARDSLPRCRRRPRPARPSTAPPIQTSRGERVVDRRREAMLGREPVVDADHTRTRCDGEHPADGVDVVERAEDPASAVEVGDRADRLRDRLVDPRGDRTRRAGNLDVAYDRHGRPGADQRLEGHRRLPRLLGRQGRKRRRSGLGERVEKLLGLRIEHHQCASSAATSGVPYVWKLSIVFTPQDWPRARSACRPHDRLEVRVVDEVAAGRDLDAVAARLEPVEEEALRDAVLRGRGLDVDVVVDEDVRRAQALLARVDPEREVVEPPARAVVRRRRRSARGPRSRGSSRRPSRCRRPARSARTGGSRGRPARTRGSRARPRRGG